MEEPPSNRADDALLKRSDLEQWEHECAELDKQINELRQRRDEVARRLERTRELLREIGRLTGDPAKRRETASPIVQTTPTRRRGKVSWTREISRILRENAGPVGFRELRAEIERGPLAERMARSDKGFYGAVGKLEKRGDLVKYKGWLFDPGAFRTFQHELAAGMRDDLEDKTHQRSSPMGNRILEILSRHPNGIESKRLVEELKRDPAFADVIKRNATSAYNVFTRLVKRGEIRKEGRVYYPLKENDPPLGGSDTGEVEAPPNERQSPSGVGGTSALRQANPAGLSRREGG